MHEAYLANIDILVSVAFRGSAQAETLSAITVRTESNSLAQDNTHYSPFYLAMWYRSYNPFLWHISVIVHLIHHTVGLISRLDLLVVPAADDLDLETTRQPAVVRRRQKRRTLKPIFLSLSASTSRRPSKTKAGLLMWSYTCCQSISRNSFHSVATMTASLSLHASSAEWTMVTCFLTGKRKSCQNGEDNAHDTQIRTVLELPVVARVAEIFPDLRLLDLRVVDRDVCTLCQEVADEGDGSSLTSVAGVGLERETEDSDVLHNAISFCAWHRDGA